MKDRAHWPDDLKCDLKEPSVPLIYDSHPVNICYSSRSCQVIALRPPFTLGLWNFIKLLLISCCYIRRHVRVCLSSLLMWNFVFNWRFIPRSRHQKSSSLRINTSSYIRKKSLILQTNRHHLVPERRIDSGDIVSLCFLSAECLFVLSSKRNCVDVLY